MSEARRIRRYYAISLFADPSTTRNPRVIVETVDKTALSVWSIRHCVDLFKEYNIVTLCVPNTFANRSTQAWFVHRSFINRIINSLRTREYLFAIKRICHLIFIRILIKRSMKTNHAYSTLLLFHSSIIFTFDKMQKETSKSNYIRIKNRLDKYPICPLISCEQLSNSYLFLAKIATRYVVSRPFSTPQCLRFGELTASWFTEEADRGAKQHRDSSGPLGFNYTLILFPLTFRVVGPCATHIAALSSVSCVHQHVYTYTRDQSTTNHRAIVFSIALKRSLEKKRDLWKSKNFLFFFFLFFLLLTSVMEQFVPL